ncbi:MAG: C_GCAxxG_C_C family protein [Clostridia bacterium]|nr:C_GCAxxG_C_C family protein [Clostridia bacterium]
MTRKEQAIAYFKEGHNCAQAVFLTFADLTGFDEKTALKLAAPFGGGLGRQREVCGAVSGMCLVAGALYGYDDANDKAAKAAHYKMVQELCARFRERAGGSIICRDLLGTEGKDTAATPSDRTNTYYQKRPCAELVGIAAELLDNWLTAHPLAK